MKILTLNLHCFAEESIDKNQKIIANYISDNNIDVVLLQEVAQPIDGELIKGNIKKGNYAHTLQSLLKNMFANYNLTYDFGNKAFNIYDEGLAILSRESFVEEKSFYVSSKVDYEDWHTRIIVSAKIKVDGEVFNFTTTHLGWTDGEEKFEEQFDKLLSNLDMTETHIIAGDFNVSQDSKEYQYIVSKGLNDVYFNNEKRYFNDVTHLPYIDVKKEASRIDYIFSNKEYRVNNIRIAFKNKRVSDHFGVFMEITKK